MMNEEPGVAAHLKRLAQDYRNMHLALQTRYQQLTTAEDFLIELRQREAVLMNRFRLLQQQLLATLEDEELEKMLELSRVSDEMRIINQFAIQALTETTQPADHGLDER